MVKRNFTVVMSDEWKDLCTEFCEEFGISFSAMVRSGIELFIRQRIGMGVDIPDKVKWEVKLQVAKEMESQAERAAK